MHPLGLFLVFGILTAIGAIWGAYAAKKRREAMFALATRLGLRFSPDKDRNIDDRFRFLGKLAQGSGRYAFNILSGEYGGHEVMAFDYHYETHSTNSKGQRQTHHHYFSFFMLFLPKSFRELTIAKEGFLSKIAQSVGYDDIDFESHEFSRSFCVRSGDKKFAYDVCNARMIEYFLANRDLSIEIESNVLAMGFGSRLDASQVEFNLHRLLEIRSRMPDYLFA